MAGKRKTLPNNFDSVLKTGTLSEWTEVMKKCVPNAVGSYYKYNAFGFSGITPEFAKWLLEYGTELDWRDNFGYTPLHHQAMRFHNYEQLKLYIELGADLDAQSTNNGSPLHGAADHGCAENIKLLIESGADIYAKTNSRNPEGGQSALEFVLSRSRGADIVEKIDAIEVLIKAGVPVTDKVKGEVKRIGENIEFHRASFPEEREGLIDGAIGRLYELSGVAPAAKRRMHDGVSSITVVADLWQAQFQELWDYLIPSMGACQTVQGEVIRVSGRVADEMLGNGGVNWDADYQMMMDSLKQYLSMGTILGSESMSEAEALISQIRVGNAEDTQLLRLQELCVQWVLANPQPISMKRPPYRR